MNLRSKLASEEWGERVLPAEGTRSTARERASLATQLARISTKQKLRSLVYKVLISRW